MMIRSLGGIGREDALQIWETSSKINDRNDYLYVCYSVGEVRGVVVDIVRSDLKLIRAFSTAGPALAYAERRGNGCKAGQVKAEELIMNMSSAYADQRESQVLCVLTEQDRAGNLYGVDVIWQLNCN